ncbi:MAG: RNA 2',3'-cyclic phosphodiesterase [Candidatus Poribacteria bacterium]
MKKRSDEVIRAFIAIELTEEIHNNLKKLQDSLKDSMPDVRWVKYGNAHLTLKFLGDTKVSMLDAIGKTIQSIADKYSFFTISLAGLGAFPNSRKPNVIWTSINKGKEEIAKLAVDVESAMERLGFPKEKRAFKPHLTIGRVREIRHPLEMAKALENPNIGEIGEFIADRISLIKSQLDPGGSIYTTLSEGIFCPSH